MATRSSDPLRSELPISVETFFASALRRLQSAPAPSVHLQIDRIRADAGDDGEDLTRAFRVLAELARLARERPEVPVVLQLCFPLEDSTRLDAAAPSWNEVTQQLIAPPTLVVATRAGRMDQGERNIRPLEGLPEPAGAGWTATYECWRTALSISAGWEEYLRQIVVTVVPSSSGLK